MYNLNNHIRGTYIKSGIIFILSINCWSSLREQWSRTGFNSVYFIFIWKITPSKIIFKLHNLWIAVLIT